MITNEERAHDFAMMVTKLAVQARIDVAKKNNTDTNIDGERAMFAYIDAYKQTLEHLND
ncbi:hypothetical protein H7198_03520 [Fructobacillus sp. CRL 2054]|uniref:hypothetical protein n=1 Tax=Fructobacillus sp. CRL 2054 TaxID=2763007 RepID=UPI00237864E9|nr:hypothetical protein [Fructobacillus sp. CRL 2054]MDD9138670.1 hypothetical protein [Fructobacillus sp. CRL 2054]